MSDRLRSQLDDFRTRYTVPAVGGCIVTRSGVAALDVVGVRARGRDDPVRRDDRWHIGSCGKSITAALYARLVERSEAEWGAPLPDLFPDLGGAIDPGWRTITIDDVFVSQAGLPANPGRRELRAAYQDSAPLPEQRTRVAAKALARAPRRPGRFLYSNLGYIVIGAAIERITGTEYESALATHVLEPLGIASGGFGPPGGLWGHGGRILALGPLGMFDLGGGAPADPAAPVSDNPAVMSPAGRLHVSLEDWARFQRVFLDRGGGFFLPETVERLLTPAPGGGYRQAFGWAPAQGLDAGLLGQQGSNTFWVATALMGRDRDRTAMVVCNEGSARLLKQTPRLAAELLAVRLPSPGPGRSTIWTVETPLTGRQREILCRVVEEYVATGQPVGSRTLVERAGVPVSPSTVRAELAELERLGLLTHPHTSAGRVPTEAGYRVFVDVLLERQETRPAAFPLGLAAARAEVEEALQATTDILSHVTRLLALVSAPPLEAATVRHVDVLQLQPNVVVVVVITSTGGVSKQRYSFPDKVDAGVVTWAGEYLRERLTGVHLRSRLLAQAFDELSLSPRERAFLGMIRGAFDAVEEERRLYVGGAAGLLDELRSEEIGAYRSLIDALEKRAALLDVLAQSFTARRPFVRVGDELEPSGLHDLALVGATYGLTNQTLGAVSLLGPLRMDYEKALRSVRSAAHELSRFVEEVYEDT